ncbi:putative ferric-chelate reductase 1 [Dreissena polymorpha]|uniref:Cytochrome b561 domain-containing protein n=1 Tax=Dreissena polymorpha TaxID=45954 RepID=A0A9D4BJ76_DREPO|nr:putative ferric-chelate reductase 1 [Dreissena polymorpha]XP_052255819.1 putative ferric-chelate reductase 1 [Dreissena polymorpha]KAH3696907.1 hypothetical protein DPMN_084390 [Dreissena polymorpha]
MFRLLLVTLLFHRADFQALEGLQEAEKYIHAKIHGCLMIFAWVFCASIGIFLARFYKPMWPNISFFRERVWFVVHQTCMVFAVLFCIAAFIIIFVFEKKWSLLDGHTQWQKAHPYLGVIVTFLCVLNPILALLRPHPDSKNRFIFNWLHWFVGMCAFILAAMTLIIGVTLGKAQVHFSCSWVLLAWIIYQMIVMLLMDIVDCCVAGNRQWYKAEGRLKEPKWSLLRKVVLGVHVIIISCFTVACIVIVATG